MVTGVVLLMILLVFAVQTVLACHPVLDSNCDDLWVDVVDGSGTLVVTVDGDEVYNGPAEGGDHFQWSLEELGLEPCLVHEVVASYGGITDNLSVGGLACCDARLNLSHIDCLEPLCEGVSSNIWIHFVMVHKPDNVKDWGQVDFSITIPGVGTVSGSALFDKVTGDTVHYNGYATGGDGTYTLINGAVTITFNDDSTVTVNLANPGDTEVTNCECPPTPVCTGVNADIDHNTMLITGSGNGLGDEWQVVKTADATVKDSDSGNTASFSFTGEHNVQYQLQFRFTGGEWSSEGCTFSFEPPPTPVCTGVNADIDPVTMLVTGSGTGQGTQWRVIRVSDNHVMTSGFSAVANFAFNGEYEESYRLQFRWNASGAWSTSGCLFTFSQTLGLTSSLYCEESTGLWHLSKGISNLSINRTYEVTVQVGSKTGDTHLGPGQNFSVEKTTKEGTILSWWIWVGGKVFAQGTEGPFGPCGEVPFVPEWNTIYLLGGGLSGLAGYAKLRLRKR